MEQFESVLVNIKMATEMFGDITDGEIGGKT